MDSGVLLRRSVNSVFLEVKLECELNPEKYNTIHMSILPPYIKNSSLSVVKNNTTVPK